MRESKVVYAPIYLVEDCLDQETAQELQLLYQTIINSLAKNHPVYVKKSPSVWSIDSFDSNAKMYRVGARFTVGPLQAHSPGVIYSKEYDICGFGLTPTNKKYETT